MIKALFLLASITLWVNADDSTSPKPKPVPKIVDKSENSNPFEEGQDMQFGGIPNSKPGLKIRLAQGWIETLKSNLL
jgi:hypothetical protein